MGFERTVPKSVDDLLVYLLKIFENRSHVKSIQVNKDASQIEVKLDFFAHHNPTGDNYPDVSIPLKKDQVNNAAQLVDGLWACAKTGNEKKDQPPTKEDAVHLCAMIEGCGASANSP